MAHVVDPTAIQSGHGSRNGMFSYGYATYANRRPSMEDFFEIRISEVEDRMVAFFGVFDGHGGPRPHSRISEKPPIQQFDQSSSPYQRHQLSNWSVVVGFSVLIFGLNLVGKKREQKEKILQDSKFSLCIISDPVIFLFLRFFQSNVEVFRQTDVAFLNQETGRKKTLVQLQ